MADLLQSARLFEVSSKLQSVSATLGRMSKGVSPEEGSKPSLEWAGNLLMQVDWTCDLPNKSGLSGQETAQATSTRPVFYKALRRIRPEEFRNAGIIDKDTMQDFLNSLYMFLISNGTLGSLTQERLSLSSRVLSILSRTLLSRLNNNGVPRQPNHLTFRTVGD